MKEGYEKYCRNGLCDSKSRPKRDKMDEHRHEDPKDKCWYSGCQCPGERLIIPKEIHLEDIFNDEKKQGIKKLIQKQKLIDMMEQDEQLGLYQETLEEGIKQTTNPTKEDSYICRMDNCYIKMCYWNGVEWLDMWKSTLDGIVKNWIEIPNNI